MMASSGLTSTAAPQTKQGGTPYTRSARCQTRTNAKYLDNVLPTLTFSNRIKINADFSFKKVYCISLAHS